MRGAVNAALRAALTTANEPAQSDISAALYAIARDCRWTISSFDWRAIHRTFHLCSAETSNGAVTIIAGADAPVVALSRTASGFQFFDDAAFSSAAFGYAPSMQVLLASDLNVELSNADQSWLISLGPHMDYNLNYWRPRTIGEVVFNFWD